MDFAPFSKDDFLLRKRAANFAKNPILNMELICKVYLDSCVQPCSLAETRDFPPSPLIWANIPERYWSAKIYEYTKYTFLKSVIPERMNNGEVALQVYESQVPDDQGMN